MRTHVKGMVSNCDAPIYVGPLTTRQLAEYMWSLSVSMPQNECLFTQDSNMSKNGHVEPIHPYSPKVINYITIVSRVNYTLIQTCLNQNVSYMFYKNICGQCPVVEFSYLGYSPPKCSCNGTPNIQVKHTSRYSNVYMLWMRM